MYGLIVLSVWDMLALGACVKARTQIRSLGRHQQSLLIPMHIYNVTQECYKK